MAAPITFIDAAEVLLQAMRWFRRFRSLDEIFEPKVVKNADLTIKNTGKCDEIGTFTITHLDLNHLNHPEWTFKHPRC
jgi:hypothetical protein